MTKGSNSGSNTVWVFGSNTKVVFAQMPSKSGHSHFALVGSPRAEQHVAWLKQHVKRWTKIVTADIAPASNAQIVGVHVLAGDVAGQCLIPAGQLCLLTSNHIAESDTWPVLFVDHRSTVYPYLITRQSG